LPRSDISHPNNPSISVRTVRGMGRGVFAGRPFRKGEVIEVCPVLVLPESVDRKCKDEILDKYFFAWDETGDVIALAFGFGSLYNHSPDPNAAFAKRKRDKVVVFRAKRDIRAGEQIFVDYEWEEADYHFPTADR
jgi:uncharacterized protein